MSAQIKLGVFLSLLVVGMIVFGGFVLAGLPGPLPGSGEPVHVMATVLHEGNIMQADAYPKDMQGWHPSYVYHAYDYSGEAQASNYCVAVYPPSAPPGTSYCSSPFFACEEPGTYWQIGMDGGENDLVVICAPEGLTNMVGSLEGKWLDLDQLNETGMHYCDRDLTPRLKLARAGISTEYRNGVDYYFGEYTGSTNMECCGDDSNEVVVTEHCTGGGGITPLCCPADQPYKIFGDACIAADSCPDVQKVPPVWLGISDNRVWAALNIEFGVGGDQYCCDTLTIPEPYEGLCSHPAIIGDLGCILDTNTQFMDSSMVYPNRQWCDTTINDDYCVYESGTTLNQLETSMSCNETVHDVNVLEAEICYGTDRDVTYEACYNVMPEGCDEGDVLNIGDGCYEVEEIHCDGNDCEALCPPNPGSGTICNEICQSYDCETITTYRGACDFLAGCDPALGETKCVEIGEPIIDAGRLNCEQYSGGWYYKETTCWEGNYPGGDVTATYCRNEDPRTGERFEIMDEDENVLYCFNDPSQNDGDPWCPKGYIFSEGFCKMQTQICDQGMNGVYQYGCDNLYTPDDDPLFNEYQAECVGRSIYAPPLTVYDQTCCYASEFNGFELYEWGRENTYVKIY